MSASLLIVRLESLGFVKLVYAVLAVSLACRVGLTESVTMLDLVQMPIFSGLVASDSVEVLAAELAEAIFTEADFSLYSKCIEDYSLQHRDHSRINSDLFN